MFSYLRPHHKRTPSNPTSPAEQVHSFEPPLHHAHPQRYQDVGLQDQPATSPSPSLPPIARVSSAESSLGGSRAGTYEGDTRTQSTEPSRNTTRLRDTYGFSNHQRIPYVGKQRPESAGNAVPTKHASPQFTRSQPGMNQEPLSRPKPGETGLSFVTAADLEKRPGQTGRRPNGARLPSPPPASNYSTYLEPVQQRSGKTRLNLLNPMSLLARRRTSQAVTQLSPEALVSNRAGNEKVFDPRIKGTVVHDFSAPRTKRNVSYNDVRTLDATINNSRQFQRSPNGDINATDDTAATSPWSGGNHTPVFTENFEEEQYPAAGPHVRKASDLTDLPLPKPPYAKGAQKLVESNSLSKINEATQKQILAARRISARKPAQDIPPPVPPKEERDLLQESKRVSIDPSSTPPKATSSKKGRPRNVSEVSAKDAVIPKHMKSTSSRFSFDMIGAAEQERLLEDRHRKRALEKKAEQDEDDRLEDEFEDNYDFDNMDDDGGLEERIPGINADLDDDDFEERIPGVNVEMEDDLEERIQGVNAEMEDDLEERIPGINAESDDEDPYVFEEDSGNLAGFTFQQSSLASPMSPSSPGMVSTPRDANGEVIGFAMTKNSPYIPDGPSREPTIRPPSSSFQHEDHSSEVQGLGLQGLKIATEPQLPMDTEAKDFPRPATLDDDDLYFDDGLIGIGGPGDFDDPVEFDESVFDQIDTDEYGRPLRSLSSLPTLYSPPMLTADPSPSFNKAVDKSAETHDPLSPGIPPPLVPQPSISAFHPPNPTIPPSLTQDTLAAYQSALAEAACTAAANGKFRRDSIQTPSEQEDPHPGLVTDSSHTSHYEPFSPTYEMEDDFDYDDVLEDDAIIAAANAEALANDCDGFYGQEFGFYSAPAASEAEYANGGYFGPRGAEGINRSQSGRVVSREPNLTPITERSEYSNRNSFMSFSMNGPGAIQSPGLAQLAGMLRSPVDYEGDMSLDALLKLRRGAWGGSQASLHSSNGSPRSAGGLEENSPVGQLPPWTQGGAVGNPNPLGGGHRRKNSGFSLVSEAPSGVGTGVQSESESVPGSPTMTMSLSQSHLGPLREDEGHSHPDEQTPEVRDRAKEGEKEKDKGIRKHRYTGSAESISYLKEDDPVSGERWILERRRTGESGEIEFLGREVVSGGRI